MNNTCKYCHDIYQARPQVIHIPAKQGAWRALEPSKRGPVNKLC